MNKKQRNRKLIAQNKRNRIINRRYSSTIKTLSKFFNQKIKNVKPEQSVEKNELSKILSNLYSIIDKAVKKKVLHRNTASRKKSKLIKIFAKL
jgi:small subunit ribosomal protein S20